MSPVGPLNKTLCPASPSLQWVLWASVPHLPGQDINTLDHRYYDPLRLPNARLGVVRSSLSAPDTLYRPSLPLCLPHSIIPVRDSLRGGTFHLNAGISPYTAGSPSTILLPKEAFGPPKSPSYPHECMPWSSRRRRDGVPGTSPLRAQNCCLPPDAKRRLSSPTTQRDYPPDHN